MRSKCFRFVVGLVIFATAGRSEDGPYKVLKTAKVGGAGGFDYIYAKLDANSISHARPFKVHPQHLRV